MNKYPNEFNEGVWQIVIDVNTYKYTNGLDVLPQLTTEDIINNMIIVNKFANFPYFHELHMPRWSNVKWMGGRLIFLVFGNGSVKRIPSNYVSYTQSIDLIPAGQIIHDILKNVYENSAIRIIRKNRLIKNDLFNKVGLLDIL